MRNYFGFIYDDYQCPVCLEGFCFLETLNEHARFHFQELDETIENVFPLTKPLRRIKIVSVKVDIFASLQ